MAPCATDQRTLTVGTAGLQFHLIELDEAVESNLVNLETCHTVILPPIVSDPRTGLANRVNSFFKIWANPGLFFVCFRPFHITNQLQIEKV